MQFINEKILRFYTWTQEDRGQTMAEYGLILALISVAAVAALLLLGPKISNLFTTVTNKLG